MSIELTEIEDVEWENVARRIFYECLASSSFSSSISSFSSLSSTTSKVTVKTLIDYIRNNASGNYRNKYLLDELQKSIEEVAWDDQVNYTMFKKASRRWVSKIHNRIQDGNNNVSKDDSSNDFSGRSDDEKQNSADSSDNDRDFGISGERPKKVKTPSRFLTAEFVDLLNVSSYSPSSEATQGCIMSDTTPESADDTDSGCGVAVGSGELSILDLRHRVRRFDEENALLREDLVRAEELANGLQRQMDNLRQKLDQTKEQCRQLERENDEHRELLHEAKEKERDCRWSLQKLEKEKNLLVGKLEDAEAEKQQISLLNSKLEKCKKEKYKYMREATVCQGELEDKQRECESLNDQLARITEVNKNLQETHDKNVQRLREKVQELKKEQFVLHAPDTVGSPSDGICPTVSPIGFSDPYTQSTPYNNDRLHDSLYDELKASGFSAANESRVRELENELSLYEEEIHQAVSQINNIMDHLCQKRSTPHVPDLNLNDPSDVKTSEISLFLRKVSELSNVMNEIIWRPKVKDASSQLCVDSNFTNELLFRQYGILNFNDHSRFAKDKTVAENERRENLKFQRDGDVFLKKFSMNSRLLGEYVEEFESSSEQALESCDTDDDTSVSCRASTSTSHEIHENTIIDPIVQELDRILQCTNKTEEESTIDSSALKNPRHRCIYTTVDNSATDSTLNSPKRLQPNFASTYVESASGGDGFSRSMFNDKSTLNENPGEPTDPAFGTISMNDLATFDADCLTESVPKSQSFGITKIIEIDRTNPSDSAIYDEKSSLKIVDNYATPSSSGTPVELSSTPRIVRTNFANNGIIMKNDNSANNFTAKYENLRNLPKRKISVFHRSFDIDELRDDDAPEVKICTDTYRLDETAMSAPREPDEMNFDDRMELDHECMKTTTNERKYLLNYREKNGDDSDSSSSLSPLKSLDNYENSPLTEIREISCHPRPIVLAPTKLKLSSLAEIPPYAGSVKNDETRLVDDDETKNHEARCRLVPNVKDIRDIWENTNLRKNEISCYRETSSIANEISRPTWNEIERGVTYRKKMFSRELEFSNFSLLSSMNDPTSPENQDSAIIAEDSMKNIVSSDGDSTSCDSTPKRESSVLQTSTKLPFLSTYETPDIEKRIYARQDPSISRGSWQDLVEEAGCGYETRNDGAASIGNYGGGNGQGKDEKANVSSSAVALAMSSGEDSSDSECDPMAIQNDDNNRRNVVNETRSMSPTVLNFADGALLGTSTPSTKNNNNNNNNSSSNKNIISIVKKLDEIPDFQRKKSMAQKRDKKERPHPMRRSLSDSGCGISQCRYHLANVTSTQEEFNKDETRANVFPSLTDIRLQESGIAKLSSTDELGGTLLEADLERRYMALSVGLVTDRVTLSRRVPLSIRQRDQSERNLCWEVEKMHQGIQDLAPLCIDRESVERVERVRHQLEMIKQCAHRVSCTAETLGAVHQENRISRAILLADRYVLVLRSRCEKLALDLAETKRILTENNIVIEEQNGEIGDDMPRTRYRGVPITNRTMMARRRASIATIFRPLGNFQDVTKDGMRQRNSVPGRITLRRPSLSAESQKWEAEKLDRTDSSSSSIGELREIFEQAESRRDSREENNNSSLRLNSSNLSVRDCENSEIDVWTIAREQQEPAPELTTNVDGCHESRNGRRTPLPHWTTTNHAPWKTMLWCIIISFFFGFYVKHAVSSTSECSATSLRWWSIEEILGRYLPVKDDSPRPI